MQKFKLTIIFSAFGFILSLICGLLARFSFVRIIIQALVCAVVFALLSLLIKFLYDKFLSNEGSLNSSLDISDEQPIVQNGSVVDLTVGEEDLPKSNNENHYYVGENHQMLTETDISGDNDFVPLRNKETINNLSETESVKPSDANYIPNNNNTAESGNDLDVLPDLSDMETSNEPRDNMDDDSGEFGSNENSVNKKKGVGDVDMKDTELIAKAISSVLSNDEAS
ncbi:MAG: multidrug effflux MFS transporter [Treponema sp.]|jgi:prepilin signal peptidase PulO-like enzyme (type II secretory pathway)|nr:multidrug effflux MFS transporter [Treponema sp.]